MGRIIFIIGLLLNLSSAKTTPVVDAGAVAKMGEVLSQGNKALKQGGEALKSTQEMAGDVKKSLTEATKRFGELQKLNSVLGSPLSSHIMKRIGSLKNSSAQYGSLLGMLSKEGDASSLNNFSKKVIKTPDCGRFIRAKNYIEQKYFKESKGPVSIQRATAIKRARERASRKVVLNSLAVSEMTKIHLTENHESLKDLSDLSLHSTNVNHQLVVQTKLLMRAVENLEKIIFIQSQQLEFMAKTYLGDRGIVLDKSDHDSSEPIGGSK